MRQIKREFLIIEVAVCGCVENLNGDLTPYDLCKQCNGIGTYRTEISLIDALKEIESPAIVREDGSWWNMGNTFKQNMRIKK